MLSVQSMLIGYPKIMKREFSELLPVQTGDHVFRIMQWNTLARALCSHKPGEATSFTAKMPVDVYDWDKYRKWRILEELLRFECDIICLEEVDSYEEIKEFLHQIG
jgi:mRNA deadenylase 3'-5' endonuclease subunit Ccr4